MACEMKINEKNRDNNAELFTSCPENFSPTSYNDIKIAGIEGGSTHSYLTVMNAFRKKLAHVKGPGTNHWHLGMKEVTSRINTMIEEAKEILNIPKSQPFHCVGLCLSGCEEEKSNEQMIKILQNDFPNASKDYVIGSDTMGSLKTDSNNGGIVLIAGTGSNARLINTDGSTYTCGGWGHMLGDEGSAYGITYRACKYVIDDMDHLEKAPYPTNYIWSEMKTFFHINNGTELLPHFYANFSKHNIAMFAKELAKGCSKNDPLCKFLFAESGRMLARHILALYKKAEDDMKMAEGGIKVICVGSVWKSWDFLKEGFVKELDNKDINELTLLRLKVPSTIGACYMAAEKCNIKSFVNTYDGNSAFFFHYKRNNSSINGESVEDIDNSCKDS